MKLRTIQAAREETVTAMAYSFLLAARVLFYAPSHRQIAHTRDFVISVLEHWLEWEIAQWIHHGIDPTIYRNMSGFSTTEIHLAPFNNIPPKRTGRKEMFYLTTHSTHFIYGYMASDIW